MGLGQIEDEVTGSIPHSGFWSCITLKKKTDAATYDPILKTVSS